ncbi:DUF485 domain-containing protein [Sinosporangium siamense]|uniref:Clumping factor B n=1 Tax=Sinosporangium siamense TaxID=1367973 RepID=A0A919RPW7_9ACTN|nr:DUF485 domain-containing protein [Sinosporangium siamense]GII96024.1 clumping factor B [Sinosporangium siamense]
MDIAEDTTESRPETGRQRPETSWQEIQRSSEFVELRRRQRGFAFPLTAFFLAWYLLYVLLADYAHEFMATKVVGNITLGLVLGLLQFVSTFLISAAYVWFANRRLDPVVDDIRQRVEV